MPPPILTFKGKVIWYPGIIFGRPRPSNIGQALGFKSESQEEAESTPGLVWTTTEQLLIDLDTTCHLSGVISVLEVLLRVDSAVNCIA